MAYLTGLVIIAGAEMNSVIEHASPHGKEAGEKSPGRKAIGARAARELRARQQQRPRGGARELPNRARPRRGVDAQALVRVGVVVTGAIAALFGRRGLLTFGVLAALWSSSAAMLEGIAPAEVIRIIRGQLTEIANSGSGADVLKRAVADAQDLLRGEIALAKAEVRQEAKRVGAGVALLTAAAVGGLIGVVLLLTAAAWAFEEVLGWPVWAGFAVVGLFVTVVAAVLAYAGRSRLAVERHLPRTVDTMKENMEWMRTRTS